jgi:hypothetical protein
MRQAGQQDPRTFRRYYQPSNSGVDGQGTFLGKERREVVSDVFRELSIPYNPNLSQRLPASERYNLELSQEYIALEKEIASLVGSRDSEARKQLEAFDRRNAECSMTLSKCGRPDNPTNRAISQSTTDPYLRESGS